MVQNYGINSAEMAGIIDNFFSLHFFYFALPRHAPPFLVCAMGDKSCEVALKMEIENVWQTKCSEHLIENNGVEEKSGYSRNYLF